MMFSKAVVALALAGAAEAFGPSLLAGLPSIKATRPNGMQLRMHSEGSVSRRSLLHGAAGAAVLSSGVAGASAAKDPKDLVRLENGVSFQVTKKNDGFLSGVALGVADGDFVIVDYIAYLRDGTIFDNTVKRGKSVALQIGKKQTIPGLEAGLFGMKAGEQRRIFVPARLGYGDRGVCFDDKTKGCLVPPNTDLVYDVTLVRVGPAPT
mmetsp:Transcript_16046/g.31698  ORF Transcript_16046/g.31698 Transcript_16046/m.31698 type:complete len:208 (-) Transcript_16046:115-738(-)